MPNSTGSPSHSPSQSVHTSQKKPPPQIDNHEAALVLMRYIAAADRKITDTEIEATRRVYSEIIHKKIEPEVFSNAFRKLKSTDADALQALRSFSKESVETRTWLLYQLKHLAGADEKFTKKEERRLDVIRRYLTKTS